MATFAQDIRDLFKSSENNDDKAANVIVRALNLAANNGASGLAEVNGETGTDKDMMGLPSLLNLQDRGQKARIFKAIVWLSCKTQGNKVILSTALVDIDDKTGKMDLMCEPAELHAHIKALGLTRQNAWAIYYGLKADKIQKEPTDKATVDGLRRLYRKATPEGKKAVALALRALGAVCPEK